MRAILVLSALAVATPALAQLAPAPPNSAQYSEFLVQQEMTRQQLIQQQNQLMALEAQVRTQQALADLEAARRTPRLAPPDVSKRPLPQIDTRQLASMPDDVLADSNKRVLDAAQNRR